MHSKTVVNEVAITASELVQAARRSDVLASCFPITLVFDQPNQILDVGQSYAVKATLAGQSLPMQVKIVKANEDLFELQAEGLVRFCLASKVRSNVDSCVMTTDISVDGGKGLAGKVLYAAAKKVLDATAASSMKKFVEQLQRLV